MPVDETLYDNVSTCREVAGEPDDSPVSSSFAGALWRAMRMADPPIDLDDLLLIACALPERDVVQLLMAYRLPTTEEVVLLADVLDLSLDELLECQRVANRHMSCDCHAACEACRLVPMKLRVTPDIRTALRLRKATTGRDINDHLRSILEEALSEELAVVRAHERRG